MTNDRNSKGARNDYVNTPGLRLTADQASRFWSFSPAESREILDRLVETGSLFMTDDGSYVLLHASSLCTEVGAWTTVDRPT